MTLRRRPFSFSSHIVHDGLGVATEQFANFSNAVVQQLASKRSGFQMHQLALLQDRLERLAVEIGDGHLYARHGELL